MSGVDMGEMCHGHCWWRTHTRAPFLIVAAGCIYLAVRSIQHDTPTLGGSWSWAVLHLVAAVAALMWVVCPRMETLRFVSSLLIVLGAVRAVAFWVDGTYFPVGTWAIVTGLVVSHHTHARRGVV